jgi:hypothetical protein
MSEAGRLRMPLINTAVARSAGYERKREGNILTIVDPPSLVAVCPRCGHGSQLPSEALPALGYLAKGYEAGGSIATVSFDDCLEVLLQIVDWYHDLARDLAEENRNTKEVSVSKGLHPAAGRRPPATTPLPHRLVASATSKHFHRPECEWAQYFLGTPDAIDFFSHDDAVASRRKPCKTCRS